VKSLSGSWAAKRTTYNLFSFFSIAGPRAKEILQQASPYYAIDIIYFYEETDREEKK
jgi:hypothetical protein